MNTYIIKEKARWIRRAKNELFQEFGIEHTPFTRKEFFYFCNIGRKKYVHKEALKFVYSNAETYSYRSDPVYCNLAKEYNAPDIIHFLENTESELLPPLVEATENFLVYDYIIGKPVDSITEEEYNYLKDENIFTELTPFYNSMTYNLVRADKIYLVDLKHFEERLDLPFFIYFYNHDNCINRLYTDKNSDISKIEAHLAIDYPTDDMEIIYYNDR